MKMPMNLFRRGVTASLLALMLGAGAAQATLVPVGGEILVNTTTAEYQSSPDVAMDEAGNFVVVWSGGVFLGDLEIFAQRYDASGTPLGSEFQVNTFTGNEQSNPRVGMDADGNFVVIWNSEGQFPPAIFSVMGQRYDNTGAPVGGEFLISSGVSALFPDVAMSTDGAFLVASVGTPAGSFDFHPYAWLYDSAGTPQQTTSILSSAFFGEASVTATPGGDWIIVWNSASFFSPNADILAQRLDADGNLVGPQVVVQAPGDSGRQDAAVVANSDRIVVSWIDNTGDRSIHARIFDSSLAPLSGELLISTLTGVRVQEPVCAMDDAGSFVVSWTESEQAIPSRDGSGSTVLARAFDPDGNPVGAELVVNTTTLRSQSDSRLAMSPEGRLAVAWRGSQPGDESDVFAQVYVSNATPVARCRNLTVSAGASCTAGASIDNASFDPDAADTITLAQSPAGPYALGATGVTLTVTDNHGAASSCTGTVTVVDATPPAISCPAAITANGSLASGGAVVPFTVSATDSCDASVGVVATPPSGSLFPFGTTTVSATATDDSGSNASCSFTVTVLTPQGQIAALIDQVEALGLSPKIEKDLVKELDKALAELQKNNPKPAKAIRDLEEFIEEVQEERGDGIPVAAADALIAAAQQIIDQLGG